MNLALFLSDRCDLACDYCFLSLNRGPRTLLRDEDAARAVDAHLARAGARARVTLLGGEPLLHPELLLACARRARAGGARVGVVSNGTRLEPGLAAELAELGAQLSLSVDGPAEVHDRHRRLAGGGPSHARVLAALERLDASSLRANLVLCEDTAGRLLSSAEWLRARGFGRISFHADVSADWSEEGLRALEAALEGFGRYARALAGAGAPSPWQLEPYRRAADGPEEELFLGADGRYYASAAYLARPYGEGLEGAAGDARSGPDLPRLAALAERADEGVRAALEGRSVHTWPREAYLLAELGGRDPRAAVAAFARADALLGAALGPLAREREAARA